ncbi:hypothetical protein [Vibrio sp. 10N.261.55.A7]|uniref:hypothetical protein n=1 Tax=Vibrio TaxID=662 RepID=UPI001056BE0E|nr:hypothetical protein [Vibrio sp. 10N.261.55.A7]
MKYFLLTCLTLLIASVPATEAYAKKGKSSLSSAGRGLAALAGGIKTYDEDTLTVEALRTCMIEGNDIDKSETKLASFGKPMFDAEIRMESDEARIDALDVYFTENENTEYETDAEADVYNNKIDEYNALIDSYNAALAKYQELEGPYNERVDIFNAKVDKFDSECAGKSYYEDDLAAIEDSIK